MRDPRLNTLARHMLTRSLRLGKGSHFLVSAPALATPLVRAILEEARVMGAFPVYELHDESLNRLRIECYDPGDGGASEAALRKEGDWNLARIRDLAGEVVIRAYENDREQASIPPPVQQMRSRAFQEFKDFAINQRLWVLFEYPTPGQAQKAGMPSEAFFDFVLDTCTLDYGAMAEAVAPLKALMEKTDRVRIQGPGTDLAFSIRGIPAVPCCGECNLPDGEIFTAPVRDSVSGTLRVNTPSNQWGVTFPELALTFREGRIVAANSSVAPDTLQQILDTDEGSRYVGEFALGLHPGIRKPMGNTLFDEKIGGSFHFTPGACYDEAPNGNRSAIHWDLVMMQDAAHGGGAIFFDDVLVRKDGRFVLPELDALNRLGG